MRISDWSSDVCSSALQGNAREGVRRRLPLRTVRRRPPRSRGQGHLQRQESLMTTFNEAFAQTYTQKRRVTATRVRKPRTPVLVLLGTALATAAAVLMGWAVKFRRVVMYVLGFGFIDFALYGLKIGRAHV